MAWHSTKANVIHGQNWQQLRAGSQPVFYEKKIKIKKNKYTKHYKYLENYSSILNTLGRQAKKIVLNGLVINKKNFWDPPWRQQFCRP
jgi:hypothetical protein